MAGGARIVFNLCFVKVIMRDYRFGSMPEISRLKRRPPGSFIAYFLGGLRSHPLGYLSTFPSKERLYYVLF